MNFRPVATRVRPGPRGVKFGRCDGWVFTHLHGGKLEVEPGSLLKETIKKYGIQLGSSSNAGGK
jgi:hypothetical protein